MLIDKKKLIRKVVVQTAKKRGKEALRKFDASTVHAVANNKRLLKRILDDNKDTEYGKKYNFSSSLWIVSSNQNRINYNIFYVGYGKISVN